MTKGFVIRRPGGGGTGRIISVLIIYMKKLLDSDWLRLSAVQR